MALIIEVESNEDGKGEGERRKGKRGRRGRNWAEVPLVPASSLPSSKQSLGERGACCLHLESIQRFCKHYNSPFSVRRKWSRKSKGSSVMSAAAGHGHTVHGILRQSSRTGKPFLLRGIFTQPREWSQGLLHCSEGFCNWAKEVQNTLEG